MTRSLPLALFLVTVSLLAGFSGVTAQQQTASMPPCEAAPNPPRTNPPTPDKPGVPAAPKNLRIIKGSDGAGDPQFEMSSGPWAEAEPIGESEVQSSGPHAYYFALASRPDCMAAYSLRNQAQIEEHRRGNPDPSQVNYLWPNDPDPRRQDAAKITIQEPGPNLKTQLWLPIPKHVGESLLVTWDAWWGKEFHFNHANIDTHKAFQLGSPGAAIYTEVQARYSMGRQDSDTIAYTAVRQYSGGGGPNTMNGPVVNGRSYGSNVIGPMVGDFPIASEKWTRFWVYFRHDVDWYYMSMWAADETRAPVQLYNGLQVRPQKGKPAVVTMDGSWDVLRFEFNTSSYELPAERGTLVSYVRNAVMLKGPTQSDVLPLLQRPTR